MDETDFDNLDNLSTTTQTSPNVYTILESHKRNGINTPRKVHGDRYLKRSSVCLMIFFILNVAAICCIGCGVLVFLLTNKNTECKVILPSDFAISEKQVQSPEIEAAAEKENSDEGINAISIVSQGCHGNWIEYGNSCYLFSNESVTWLTALTRCQNEGGYLAGIKSEAEDEFVRQYVKHVQKSDCYQNKSSEYNGVRQTTYDGHVCQRWDSQTPHIHTRNKAETFPDKTLVNASNYCRDPDGEGFPWCYTTDPKIRWQHCGIYSCTGGDFWIGLVTLEGQWKWMNEKTEDTHYTHWADGKPTKGMCGYMAGTLGFSWNAQSCEYPAMYVCEKSSASQFPA
ncbi:apolipoprotein(a)-like [Ruditapes philippinarum]|uniref:apolipoprotein(a)-like n=1 Tax=Ruditapes philippinarum TaxID=129788 RepID=UPI00295BC69E|nr:apolipoprotein(a)-like [Ruditapes philippinarum]